MPRIIQSDGEPSTSIAGISCIAVVALLIFLGNIFVDLVNHDSGFFLAFLICIPLCFISTLYLPGKVLTETCYIEYTSEGFKRSALGFANFYPWREINKITSEKSPGFVGAYDDVLVFELKEKKIKKFFLHNFGFHDKKSTNEFIDNIKKAWEQPGIVKH
ncbi:MAG: hypothetical protein BAJALOKI2v1_720005 [Promethearchaeota archaeon]|nr:MAG: hypothetical protein BAJALOKI2v1_720005 [Candidatus Lokiarchaeota archaeon]